MFLTARGFGLPQFSAETLSLKIEPLTLANSVYSRHQTHEQTIHRSMGENVTVTRLYAAFLTCALDTMFPEWC
jgi:hypothetical protein